MSEKRKLSSLPKWAQMEIRVLKDQVHELKETLKFGRESDVIVDEHSLTERHLPNGSRVTFKLGQNRVRVYVDRGKLVVSGERAIIIEPIASNSVSVL